MEERLEHLSILAPDVRATIWELDPSATSLVARPFRRELGTENVGRAVYVDGDAVQSKAL